MNNEDDIHTKALDDRGDPIISQDERRHYRNAAAKRRRRRTKRRTRGVPPILGPSRGGATPVGACDQLHN